jgi:hypothetical protein
MMFRRNVSAWILALTSFLSACSTAKINMAPSLLPAREGVPPPVSASGVPPSSQADGVQRVKNVLEALQRFDRTGRNRQMQQVSFELPEADINDYLAWSLRTTPRPGVAGIFVKLHAGNHVNVRAALDFSSMGSWAAVVESLLQLDGNRVISADVAFQVHDGALTFQFTGGAETIKVRRAMQMLLHILAMHQPEKYDTSKPIPLPYGLRRLATAERMILGET